MIDDLDNLTAARLWIISEPTRRQNPDDDPRGQAYLSHALFRLIPVTTDAVPTMAVDEGWRLYVNPEWLAVTDVPAVGRELAHLLWHLLSDHATRARACGVTPETVGRWHRATDMAIDDLIGASGLSPAHLPSAPYDDHGRCPSAEELYALLAADSRHSDCGSGADGIARDYEADATAELPAVTAFEARALTRGVAQALTGGSRPGAADGALVRWANAVVSPRVQWQQVLAGAVRRAVTTVAGRGDYTYCRPSRRSASTPRVLLPSQHRPVPRVAVVVDTSGSMNRHALGRALAELDSILATFSMADEGITVFTVDTIAYRSTRVRRAIDIDLLGGGGTDMSIGIAAAATQRPRPELTIVFTDGFTPWPAEPVPGITVIAALIGEHRQRLPQTPEWMVRVECVDDDR